MNLQNNTVSVFWPNDIILTNNDQQYVVLGYRINEFKIVIIDVMNKNENKLLNYGSMKGILKNLEIIYTINCKHKNIKQINYDYRKQQPLILFNEIIILFKPPKSWKLEYYSLDPITINIFWNSNDEARSIIFQKPTTNKYNNKMNFHWISNTYSSINDKNNMIEELRIINLTNYIRSKINPEINTSKFGIPNDIRSLFDMIFTILFFFYFIFIQKPCYILTNFFTYPFIRLKYKYPCKQDRLKFSLSTISYSFHQINFRFRQFYNLPLQFRKLKISKLESEASILKGTRFSPSEYIKFYNTVWMIINDLLLGIIFSNTLKANHDSIVHTIQTFIPQYETLLSDTISWLMNSPAGFKLNNELAEFMGQLIFWVLDLWKNITLKWAQNNVDNILIIIETVTSYCGLALFISISMDLINIFFLNIYGFYIACTRLYSWQLSIVMSLFQLFYGKKYNILRNRVDFNDYEFDQLMLGIILFTILIYLMPTVFIFYLTFAILRLFILFISLFHKYLLILLNHIPIVVLLLKLKNQERLPAGVFLDFQNGIFVLKSRPLTMKQIYISHMNSMLNFNLFNLNHPNIEDRVHNKSSNNLNNQDIIGYEIADVVENWNRISFFHVTKTILFGETIQDYDYNSMF